MDKASCSYEGNADMYGLGIRLGFYLQWFAKITADILMPPSEIKAYRFATYSFTAAVFIALSIQTAQGRITDLDGYIVLLLCFGNYYSLVPVFLWRALTCFNARLDPTRWTPASSGIFLRVFSSVISLAISAYQIAFWAKLIDTIRTDDECDRVGFLLAMIPLHGKALKIVNITFSSFLLLIGLLAWMDSLFSKQRRIRRFLEEKTFKADRSSSLLVWFRAFLSTLVAVAVISGTEMTIASNNIQRVNALDSLGQLIPFILGVVVLGRIPWVALTTAEDGAPVDGEPVVHLQDRLFAGNSSHGLVW